MNEILRHTLSICLEGGSHEPFVGVRITGIPVGATIDKGYVQRFVWARRPQNKGETTRREADTILWEGVDDNGKVLRSEIRATLANTQHHSDDYAVYARIPRPSHVDYVAGVKYGTESMLGGGAFSGRMTAPLCVAGGIALDLLRMRGISVVSEVHGVGDCLYDGAFDEDGLPADTAARERMLAELANAKADHDSVGGLVRVIASGVPTGTGGMGMWGLESVLSSLLYTVPGVKGVSFGDGFSLSTQKGSYANDAFAWQDGKVITTTNHSGGINGGLANGMPIVADVALRPTPSIGKLQHSVDLIEKKETTLTIGGRHDACIALRARFALMSCVAIGLLDALFAEDTIHV